MPETPEPQRDLRAEMPDRLKDLAQMIRDAGSLDPDAQHALAQLVEELSSALQTAQVPAEEVTHLASSTAHLAEAIHHPRDQSLLSKARERLEHAVTNAEAQAPVAVGLARRLLEALSDLGI